MKRRTRDFRAWLVEAISCYDASAELFRCPASADRVSFASPRRRRLSASLSRIFPPSARSVRGRRLRFDYDDIRRLYESSDYPRRRRKRQLS